MGRKMDALLRRNFRTAKFKALVNLAISRLAVLKNHRQVRCSQARSDTAQLLNLGHQDRALLRVEQVIKEQNMLDVFVMVEGYCHVLIERVVLIENNKVCPDELKEATSCLMYAASRLGEFPELQEIREVLMSWFGKEFVARAVELRNNCGVHPKIIQKLSTRQANLETRMKVLEEIASENGITLQLEEEPTATNEEKQELNQKQNPPETITTGILDNTKLGDQSGHPTEEITQEDHFSGSMKGRTRYANVASAAQAAFESAAYAAAAARAAMELSRSESRDNFSDDQSSPAPQRGKRSDDEGSSKHRPANVAGRHSFGGAEDDSEKIHPIENFGSESEDKELSKIHEKDQPENFNEKKSFDTLERSSSSSSLDSVEENPSSNVLRQNEPSDKITFDMIGDETNNELSRIRVSMHYQAKTSSNVPRENEPSDKIDFNVISDETNNEQSRIPFSKHYQTKTPSNVLRQNEPSKKMSSTASDETNNQGRIPLFKSYKTKTSSDVLRQNEPSEEISFDSSEDDTSNGKGKIPLSKRYSLGRIDPEGAKLRRSNIERGPISVRTKRGTGHL